MSCRRPAPGRRRSRTRVPSGAVAVLLATVAMTGCSPSGSGTAVRESSSTAERSPDVDAVQTDAPAEAVSISLTFAGVREDGRTVEASAVVSGLVESGGSCRLTLSGVPGGPVTGPPSAAEPGPATTECGRLLVELEAGTGAGVAEVTAAYTSPTTDVVSEPARLQLP